MSCAKGNYFQNRSSMSRESLFPQNVAMTLHCTIEPDLLKRNRPEDGYLMQDMFYIMNVKICDTSKTLAVLLLCSQRANKGTVNVRKQAIHNFKLLCCQFSHIIMYSQKLQKKVIKTFTQNGNCRLMEKKDLSARRWLKDFRELYLFSSLVLCTPRRTDLKL